MWWDTKRMMETIRSLYMLMENSVLCCTSMSEPVRLRAMVLYRKFYVL